MQKLYLLMQSIAVTGGGILSINDHRENPFGAYAAVYNANGGNDIWKVGRVSEKR